LESAEPEIVRHSSYVSCVIAFLPAGAGGGVHGATRVYGFAGAAPDWPCRRAGPSAITPTQRGQLARGKGINEVRI
jgi:hypothetical protein